MSEEESIFLDYETVESAFERFNTLRERYKGHKTRLEYRTDPYDKSGREYLRLFVERDETNPEMARRLMHEHSAKLEQEERDKREFARLKAKFNNQ